MSEVESSVVFALATRFGGQTASIRLGRGVHESNIVAETVDNACQRQGSTCRNGTGATETSKPSYGRIPTCVPITFITGTQKSAAQALASRASRWSTLAVYQCPPHGATLGKSEPTHAQSRSNNKLNGPIWDSG